VYIVIEKPVDEIRGGGRPLSGVTTTGKQ